MKTVRYVLAGWRLILSGEKDYSPGVGWRDWIVSPLAQISRGLGVRGWGTPDWLWVVRLRMRFEPCSCENCELLLDDAGDLERCEDCGEIRWVDRGPETLT